MLFTIVTRNSSNWVRIINKFYVCQFHLFNSKVVLLNMHSKLVLIKLIHTIIWIFFNVVIFYMFYEVITNKIDMWMWICLSFVILEGIVLLIFKKQCPITIIARKYSSSEKDNFDIYLPNWLAKYNKLIYTIFVAIILIILIFRLL